ncbi:MAG: hypothetical protein KDC53_05180 [Saprospiraceae bacterium]|nr:hypothetical protein [Saprospiraceae bacterium]
MIRKLFIGSRFLMILFLCDYTPVFSQDTINDEIARIVYMDSVVIKASRQDFSVSDFIKLVREDKSFYLAFRNLRAAEFLFHVDMFFSNQRNKRNASYQADYLQKIMQTCRFQIKNSEQVTGDFYKNRKFEARYYTYDLFDRLFLFHDTTCNITVQPQEINFEGEGMEGHIGELKKLIFAPGTRSDVPFIGDKSEIFSDKMRSKYNFYIRSEKYGPDSIEVYSFQVRTKPEFSNTRDNHTVIKNLTTYFAKKDFQVLGRIYQLSQYKAVYQFDVTMRISLLQHEGIYLPSWIHYEGFWNIPFKPGETANFTIDFSNFK